MTWKAATGCLTADLQSQVAETVMWKAAVAGVKKAALMREPLMAVVMTAAAARHPADEVWPLVGLKRMVQ